MSLLLSSGWTIQFIVHLSHVVDSEALKLYVYCLLEQIAAVRPGFNEKYMRDVYSKLSRLGTEILKNSVSVSSEPKRGKLSI